MAICQKNSLKVRYPKRDGTAADKTAEVCDSDYAIGQLYVLPGGSRHVRQQHSEALKLLPHSLNAAPKAGEEQEESRLVLSSSEV